MNRTQRAMRPDHDFAPTPLGDCFREHAQHRRDLAAAHPDDTRHLRGAQALDQLAVTADREIHNQGFYACHLSSHHVDDAGFAWPKGQAARAISNWGFDSPPDGTEAHELFLAELCDLATWDACRYIAEHESDFDRRDVTTIAERYGVSAERVHSALDGARHFQLYQVGVPYWHELTDQMIQALEALDGTWVDLRAAVRRADDERPNHVNNVGAGSEWIARQLVAELVELGPEVLGVRQYPRIFPALAAVG